MSLYILAPTQKAGNDWLSKHVQDTPQRCCTVWSTANQARGHRIPDGGAVVILDKSDLNPELLECAKVCWKHSVFVTLINLETH